MAQRRPRRLDTLATPSRPVPFTARHDEWKTWFYGTSIDMGETDEERRDKAALIIERWVRVYVAKKSAEKRRLARRAERKAAQAAAAAAEQGGGAAVGMLGGAAEIV